MKWFRHRVDANADIKIQQLNHDFPYIGYAIFFYTLEMIGREGSDGSLSYQRCVDYSAFFFKDESARIVKVFEKAIELGLFTLKDSVIFCPKLVNGYSDDWSNRRRKQQMLDELSRNGEIAGPRVMTRLEQDRQKYADRVKHVLEHLNKCTGKQYRWQSRDNQILIAARLKDGYTVDDLCKVIDNQCEAWLGDEKMEQYLRPQTLFCRSKIEGYLNNDKGSYRKLREVVQ